jgi:DNA mismatch repair protein MutL
VQTHFPQDRLYLQRGEAVSSMSSSFGSEAIVGEEASSENLELSELRPLGQIRDSFIVASSTSGLWLMDQHAAHERVLFEKFLAQRDGGKVESQRLLLPRILRLTASQQALWGRITGELEDAGFEVEPFGQNTVAVKAAPAGVKADDIEKLLTELVESLENESRTFTRQTVRHKIAASVACHAAIKINTPLEDRKMEWLVAQLAATQFPMSCPHGRPVVLKYDMREILKAFHRI